MSPEVRGSRRHSLGHAALHLGAPGVLLLAALACRTEPQPNAPTASKPANEHTTEDLGPAEAPADECSQRLSVMRGRLAQLPLSIALPSRSPDGEFEPMFVASCPRELSDWPPLSVAVAPGSLEILKTGETSTGSPEVLAAEVSRWWKNDRELGRVLGRPAPSETTSVRVWVNQSLSVKEGRGLIAQLAKEHEVFFLVGCPSLLSQEGIEMPQSYRRYLDAGGTRLQLAQNALSDFAGQCNELPPRLRRLAQNYTMGLTHEAGETLDEVTAQTREAILDELEACGCRDADIDSLEYYLLQISDLDSMRAFEIPLTPERLEVLLRASSDTPIGALLRAWYPDELKEHR